MTKAAIIGTQGVPAKYGGFESLVENIIGENGWKIDVENLDDIVRKIRQILTCKDLYIQLSTNALAYSKRYNIKTNDSPHHFLHRGCQITS